MGGDHYLAVFGGAIWGWYAQEGWEAAISGKLNGIFCPMNYPPPRNLWKWARPEKNRSFETVCESPREVLQKA